MIRKHGNIKTESLWLKQRWGLKSCQGGRLLILLTTSSGVSTPPLVLQRTHVEAPNQPTTKKNIMLGRKTFYLVFSDKVPYKSGFSIILKLRSLSFKTLVYYVEIFLKCSVLSCCLKGIKKK